MQSFSADLASLKRNARLRGRSITQNEVAGVTAGRANSASERLARAKGIALQEENIGVQREGIASQERISGSEIASREKLAGDDMSLKRQLQELDLKSRSDLQSQSLTAQSRNLAKQLAAQKDMQAAELKQDQYQYATTNSMNSIRETKQYEMDMINYEENKKWKEYKFETEKQQAKKARRSCIIITACTSPTSYEVEIARMFRNDFLTDNTLGGYYALCEITVPFIDRFKTIRKAVKRLLVDRFIDFAEVVYWKKRRFNYRHSEAVTMGFLGLCGIIGKFVDVEKWIKLHRE